MPRNACPHCPRGFINQDLLDRHIRFVHSVVPAPVPAPAVATQLPTRSTGYLAMVSTNPAPTATPSVPAESGSLPQPRGAYLPGMGRFKLSEVPNLPAVGLSWITRSAERIRITTDQRQGVDGVTLATSGTRPLHIEPVAQSHPTPAIPLITRPAQRGSVRFTVVYVAEAQNFSETLHLPHTTPWPSFLNELAAASTSVAPRYIPGRTDGFWLEDGAWRFSLVDNRGVVEGRWRPLTRILFYQAMISELLKPDSPWTHAQVWHEIQTDATVRPEPQTIPSSPPAQTQPDLVPAQNQPRSQAAVIPNTPINIIDVRTSFGRRSFLVQWLDGRPDSWVSEEDLEDHQILIDGYLRNLDGDRP